jgi:NADH-quinone oxidoreductase subunit B
VVDLGLPGFGVPVLPRLTPVPVTVSDGVRRADVRLLDLALACCSVEVAAALTTAIRAAEATPVTGVTSSTSAGATDAADPGHGTGAADLGPGGGADPGALPPVLVVAGTCTDALAPAVRAAYDALPEGTRVVSFGACACSGGPYWDSYSVVPGIADLVPVALFVPGCPPRPEALVAAVLDLAVGPA